MSLVWFDAHGDFNTPESSRSGYVDGMALAAAVGDSQQALLASVPGFRALPTDRVLLLGTRDLDPAEEERLAHSPVTHLPASKLGGAPLPDLGGGQVHLHLDLDVLHDSVGRVNAFRLPPGGVCPSLLLALVEQIAERAELRSVAITAYDPSLDRRAPCLSHDQGGAQCPDAHACRRAALREHSRQRDLSWLDRYRYGGPGGRPVADGAASVLWGVTLPDHGPTGGFFRDGQPLPW